VIQEDHGRGAHHRRHHRLRDHGGEQSEGHGGNAKQLADLAAVAGFGATICAVVAPEPPADLDGIDANREREDKSEPHDHRGVQPRLRQARLIVTDPGQERGEHQRADDRAERRPEENEADPPGPALGR
jgi:hypothetical protein